MSNTIRTDNSQTLADAEKRIEELEQEVKDREQDYVTLSQDKNAIIARLESQRDQLIEQLKKCERYMTERGVSHEYPIMINTRAMISEIEGGR